MGEKRIALSTQAVIDECLPLIRAWPVGRYAISIGGSHGKRIFDERSDVDFRLFCDGTAPRFRESEAWHSFRQAVARWRAQGIEIDGCWVRATADMNAQLEQWLGGQVRPVELVWTLWGYHLLTDIANQMVLEDPTGLIAEWQARLTPYPPALKRAILNKHLGSLRYWRSDYHYRNKVERGDVVFLAGIAARLVHDVLQVLFALNETHYPGDGNNLAYAAGFAIQPPDFAERVKGILYPPPSGNALAAQYAAILSLIDDVEALASAETAGAGGR